MVCKYYEKYEKYLRKKLIGSADADIIDKEIFDLEKQIEKFENELKILNEYEKKIRDIPKIEDDLKQLKKNIKEKLYIYQEIINKKYSIHKCDKKNKNAIIEIECDDNKKKNIEISKKLLKYK